MFVGMNDFMTCDCFLIYCSARGSWILPSQTAASLRCLVFLSNVECADEVVLGSSCDLSFFSFFFSLCSMSAL